jgi:hypothetical protein
MGGESREPRQASAGADAQQAAYFRRDLQGQRSELAEELATHIRVLNRYVTMGASPNVGHIRKAIRAWRRRFVLSIGWFKRWIGDSPGSPSHPEFG